MYTDQELSTSSRDSYTISNALVSKELNGSVCWSRVWSPLLSLTRLSPSTLADARRRRRGDVCAAPQPPLLVRARRVSLARGVVAFVCLFPKQWAKVHLQCPAPYCSLQCSPAACGGAFGPLGWIAVRPPCSPLLLPWGSPRGPLGPFPRPRRPRLGRALGPQRSAMADKTGRPGGPHVGKMANLIQTHNPIIQ